MAAKRIDLGDKAILYQYQNGISISKIAELSYVSKDTIYRRLRKMNIEIQSTFMQLINRNKLSGMYIDRRLSISSIAKKHGVSSKTVKKALLKYNIQIRRRNKNESTTRINH